MLYIFWPPGIKQKANIGASAGSKILANARTIIDAIGRNWIAHEPGEKIDLSSTEPGVSAVRIDSYKFQYHRSPDLLE